MAKVRNKLVDYLTYLTLRLLAMAVHLAGAEASYRVAAWAGNLMYRFDRRHRERAIENLRASFPDFGEQRLHDVAKASMRSMAYLAVDLLLTTRMLRPNSWRRYVELGNLAEGVRLAIKRETGVVVVSGHFGGWEIFGYTTALAGIDSYALARALDNPYLNDYLLGIRQRGGMRILDKFGAMARMDGIMRRRMPVGFIADQDAGLRGIFVDFFGRKASTYKAPGLTAMRYNAPVVVAYGRRLGEQFRFELGVARIIYPHEWATRKDPLRWITQEYTTALEGVIRSAPQQYLWTYRRWKSRPPAENASRQD